MSTELPRPTPDLEAVFSTAAASAGPIIVTGEEGSGRAHTAGLIHAASRRTGRFVEMRCHDAPAGLQVPALMGVWHALSEVLGPGRGSLELAEHGMVCIRQAEMLTEEAQSALLRFLSSPMVKLVNMTLAGYPRRVEDVRLALTVPTLEEVAAFPLISALNDRMDTVYVHVPPLRERPQDIERLFVQFAEDAASALGEHWAGADPKMLQSLRNYTWPGNVTELQELARHVVTTKATGAVRLPLAGRG